MSFPFTEVLSGAALLLAIASPIITSIINSYTQKREREAQFFIQHRAEVFERYVSCTGCLITCSTVENESEYGTALGNILLYVDYELSKDILTLDSKIRLEDSNEYELSNRLRSICEQLREQYPGLVQNGRNKKDK